MKLRLETGNFKITGTVDAETQTIIVNDLPKGLTSEDLIGCIVDIDINGLCVVTNTIPNTGITLPFISYGGSAVIIQLAEIGIALNVARNIGRE